MNTSYCLPDTRAYPTDHIKNELLLHAASLVTPTSKAQTTLARESLQAEITRMLAQNNYTNLSVALAMAANCDIYNILWDTLEAVLQAHNQTEVQWLALPVIVVGGAKENIRLPDTIPATAIAETFKNQPWSESWNKIHWAAHLISDTALTHIKANQWFAAKQNPQLATDFLNQLPHTPLSVESGQSVQAFYALGFASTDIRPALNCNLADTALPLMQVWHTHLATTGTTLFINPLSPQSPLSALRTGNAMRLRMACDVFTTNAIRTIRLQSPRVGVVIAAQEGGKILFGFNAADSAFELQPQTFHWPLTQADNIDSIVQNFIDLLAECQVENIRLLHEPISIQTQLPSYAQSIRMIGHNPLFSRSH
ncbi:MULTISPECIES: conjugal transfer protein [Snodgrassella]|uniref:conjugal transfer protein n=1 Tax=Snodgrassella TaxID=1193515 RepID=UPI0008162B10|nr:MULTISPECIES: conjugal transfer protein [Snodgrassella]SCB82300.1 hypothetical protein GA0061082_10263 [Snodgrassella sp. R-53583]